MLISDDQQLLDQTVLLCATFRLTDRDQSGVLNQLHVG